MRDTDLFQLALGLVPPWMVKACAFDAVKKRLDIEIDFARGGRFPCPCCAKADCPVHDTSMQEWRHLDFFQHQAFLHARTPRITCPDCGVKLVNDAVDKVRRAEVKSRPELKGTRYAWTKNVVNLTAAQAAELAPLKKSNLKTARAYHLRLAFQDIYQERKRHWAEIQLERWYRWAIRSRLEPIKDVARTILRHWDGILAWFDSRIANGLIEGINSLVQAAKAKARGYRTLRNLKAITYLR